MQRLSLAEACARKAWQNWLAAVDRLMVNAIGLDTGSIEDWDWYSEFKEGIDPQGAIAAWREEMLMLRNEELDALDDLF